MSALAGVSVALSWPNGCGQKHGRQEQKLFISFMQQCDICFTHREEDDRVEAEYIAPDLLPARNDPEIAAQL
ncbi:MAG: hypothetical protein P8Y67_10240, partial [Alphaproteobacteria bacterium]